MANNINVLYVDDDVFMHEPFKIFLEMNSGINVTTVASAVSGVELLQSKSFDAVISDYEMPEMNGLEFLKFLRSSGDDIPFILFTGRGREEVVIDALNNGADHYIQKGGDPTSEFAMLAHMVRSSVETRNHQKALRVLRRRLESFVRNTSDSIAIYDSDFNIISVNPAFGRMYGWEEKDVVNRPAPHIPEAERERRDAIARKVGETGEAAHFVAKRIRKDGRVIDVNVTLSAIRDDSGNITGYASIAKDISDLVTAMDVITQIKEEFRVILRTIGDAVISTDVKGKITYMNPAAEEMTGSLLDQVSGQNINKVVCLVNEVNRKRVEIPSERVIREGRIVGLANHSLVISSTGKECLVADLAAPLLNESGQVMGTVVVFRDVTSEKLSERREAAIHSVTEILLKAEDRRRVMHKVMGAVCSELFYDGGAVWTVDDDNRVLRLASLWSRDNRPLSSIGKFLLDRTFSVGEDLPGDVWNGAKTIWNSDILPSEGDNLRACIYMDGFRSLYAYPLFDGDALVRGVMLLLSTERNEPDAKLISTLNDIGLLAGRFMVNSS